MFVLAALWDLLFLLDSINTLPATVPIAAALIAVEVKTMAHPPPPWHLFGELIIVPALVRPRALGGVMLANYTSGTLVYRELIVFDRRHRRAGWSSATSTSTTRSR